MLFAVLIATGAPLALCGSVSLIRRNRGWPAFAADRRGIALQTVIVIVVLVIIAGAVSAVLITRTNEATTELEQQDVSLDPDEFPSESLCESAGHNWDDTTDPANPVCKA